MRLLEHHLSGMRERKWLQTSKLVSSMSCKLEDVRIKYPGAKEVHVRHPCFLGSLSIIDHGVFYSKPGLKSTSSPAKVFEVDGCSRSLAQFLGKERRPATFRRTELAHQAEFIQSSTQTLHIPAKHPKSCEAG